MIQVRALYLSLDELSPQSSIAHYIYIYIDSLYHPWNHHSSTAHPSKIQYPSTPALDSTTVQHLRPDRTIPHDDDTSH